MILVNSFGRVVEVREDRARALLKAKKMRRATAKEIQDDLINHEAMAAGKISDGMLPVYYQTVDRTPDGYGMSRDLLKTEIARLGIDLQENNNGQKVGLLYNYPTGITQMHNDVRLIFTMFESDKIPEDWPEYLNMADEVLVPSKWAHDVFLRSGVKTTVLPLGYNDRVFQFQQRRVPVQHDEDFVFIHYDSFNIRKGFIEVFKAFTEEFKPTERVKLILKTVHNRPPIPILPSEYPNIEVIKDVLTEQGLLDLLGRSHCMVYPSRGEGFGITPLEAMATGMPAIVPNAHGISEYFNAQYMLEVKADDRCPGLYNRFKGQDVGEMVVCDVMDLRRQMRHAFMNQAKTLELGRAASEYVKHFTYRRAAAQLADIINGWERREIRRRADDKVLKVETV
jgi:glycosyltransferase involved in cell wall biosynthesis